MHLLVVNLTNHRNRGRSVLSLHSHVRCLILASQSSRRHGCAARASAMAVRSSVSSVVECEECHGGTSDEASLVREDLKLVERPGEGPASR